MEELTLKLLKRMRIDLNDFVQDNLVIRRVGKEEGNKKERKKIKREIINSKPEYRRLEKKKEQYEVFLYQSDDMFCEDDEIKLSREEIRETLKLSYLWLYNKGYEQNIPISHNFEKFINEANEIRKKDQLKYFLEERLHELRKFDEPLDLLTTTLHFIYPEHFPFYNAPIRRQLSRITNNKDNKNVDDYIRYKNHLLKLKRDDKKRAEKEINLTAKMLNINYPISFLRAADIIIFMTDKKNREKKRMLAGPNTDNK